MNTISFQPMMESRPIREIAYEVLKHAIITGEIPAGERIVETDYAERLHISRTPLREALRKLERDGLVEYVLRRGVVVRAFTIADVEDIYTIRNALEMLTLPAIIEKATEEDIASLRSQLGEMDELMEAKDFDALSPVTRAFHRQLTAICGQNRILRVIEGQDEFITRFSAMAIRQEDRLLEAHREHYALVDYIEQRDLASFQELMERHINRSKELVERAIDLGYLSGGETVSITVTSSDTDWQAREEQEARDDLAASPGSPLQWPAAPLARGRSGSRWFPRTAPPGHPGPPAPPGPANRCRSW